MTGGFGYGVTDIYIGIDPGVTNCALVSFSPTRGILTTWRPKEKNIPKGVLRLRYLMLNISREFTRLASLDPGGIIQQIAIEGYSMAEKYGQHASGEVGAAIKLTILAHFDAQDRRAFPLIVQPQQLKKFATGNGNTRKDMMAKEVLKRWSEDFNDTNMAEAYALARVAYAYHAEPEMTGFQRDVIKALQGHTEWVPEPAISVPHHRLTRGRAAVVSG